MIFPLSGVVIMYKRYHIIKFLVHKMEMCGIFTQGSFVLKNQFQHGLPENIFQKFIKK